MMTGWLQLDGRYYYLHTDGRMVTGWQSDGTHKYYMDKTSGKMAVGWKQIDGAWYYFNPSGHMVTGWVKDNGKYYYMNPSDGQMISNGSYAINNINYTFDNSGVCSMRPLPLTEAQLAAYIHRRPEILEILELPETR